MGEAGTVGLYLTLNRASRTPLQEQIYAGLRSAILDGRLLPGRRLPASRALAADFGVSRNTVKGAYLRLTGEGYVRGRTGSGTYVVPELPEALLRPDAGLPADLPVSSGTGGGFGGGDLEGAPARGKGDGSGARAEGGRPGRSVSRRGARLTGIPAKVSVAAGSPGRSVRACRRWTPSRGGCGRASPPDAGAGRPGGGSSTATRQATGRSGRP